MWPAQSGEENDNTTKRRTQRISFFVESTRGAEEIKEDEENGTASGTLTVMKPQNYPTPYLSELLAKEISLPGAELTTTRGVKLRSSQFSLADTAATILSQARLPRALVW
jgi:hypothetical protein